MTRYRVAVAVASAILVVDILWLASYAQRLVQQAMGRCDYRPCVDSSTTADVVFLVVVLSCAVYALVRTIPKINRRR